MSDLIVQKKTALTGGGATALDGIDGAALQEGEFAFVMVSDALYVYRLNATSGATESSPMIISPDANAGNKRWILQQWGGLQLLLAYLSATQADVTGDGTVVSPVIFDTEIFDVGACYNNATGSFVAPVTGKYLVSAGVYYLGMSSGWYTGTNIVTSNRQYGGQCTVAGNAHFSGICTLADMDVNDELHVYAMSGGGTKVVDIYGHATYPYTYLGVALIE